MELEEELDKLYALPLDEFTTARNELAKSFVRCCRHAGSLGRLPRPCAAWFNRPEP